MSVGRVFFSPYLSQREQTVVNQQSTTEIKTRLKTNQTRMYVRALVQI